ncbi:MAG: alcohol dehydrogenase catalytic domain-containing protein [Actinobacteria bacterium]|nr:alcohol dehydrogenase catalytic domain-containing protein [Actinomycetota bacterium]
MKALVFLGQGEPLDGPAPAAPPDGPQLLQHLAVTPMALYEVEDPKPLADDWLVLKTRMCGVCGSDAKQVLMDFEDGGDNPMTGFISFPQVLGHEVVAEVVEAGPAVDDVAVGQRVVLNPWLSCAPRGIEPLCPRCKAGDLSLCENFHGGILSPGIHTGNATEATGGFAEFLPAHQSMAIPVPDAVPDEVAVLADPFSVALHAVTRNPPPDGGRALVYGSGALGTCATAILRALYPSVEVGVVAMWPAQQALAGKLGARVFSPEPVEELVEALADWSGGVLRTPFDGLPTAHPGRIDVVYDTVASTRTIEVAIRVLAERGTLVQLGLSSPGRTEWTPLYFKEIRWVGSNAFGVEEVDGVRKHAIAHYLDLTASGRVDVSAMLTHTFRLEEWRAAFETLVGQGETGAIKVAFDFR